MLSGPYTKHNWVVSANSPQEEKYSEKLYKITKIGRNIYLSISIGMECKPDMPRLSKLPAGTVNNRATIKSVNFTVQVDSTTCVQCMLLYMYIYS